MSEFRIFGCDRCGAEERFEPNKRPAWDTPLGWEHIRTGRWDDYGDGMRVEISELVCAKCLTDRDRRQLRRRAEAEDIFATKPRAQFQLIEGGAA
jgi:hypothetical protein